METTYIYLLSSSISYSSTHSHIGFFLSLEDAEYEKFKLERTSRRKGVYGMIYNNPIYTVDKIKLMTTSKEGKEYTEFVNDKIVTLNHELEDIRKSFDGSIDKIRDIRNRIVYYQSKLK